MFKMLNATVLHVRVYMHVRLKKNPNHYTLICIHTIVTQILRCTRLMLNRYNGMQSCFQFKLK